VAERFAPMLDFLQTPTAQLVLATAGLAIVLAIGFYLIQRIRNLFTHDPPVIHEQLTNFREMRSKGGLSEEEYRTIKGMLAEQIQSELKDNEEKG
jgi:uncharacterized protein YneF (UPF0154 family)